MKYAFYSILFGFILGGFFGWFLNEHLSEKQFAPVYGDIKVEQIKRSYVPTETIFHFDNNTVLVETVEDERGKYKVIKDSTSYNSDTLNYDIKHTTILEPDSIKAKTFWDVEFTLMARQDSIFLDREVIKEIEVMKPFYKNHWFYAWLGTASLLVLTILKALGV